MNFDIENKLSNLLNSLFNKTETQTSRFLEQILMLILYLFGVALWIRFLNYGNIPNNSLDWGDITFPRLQVIQQAVRQGELPLYVAEENGLKGVTNLFLSIPDQILSPDVILLRFLTIENFILIHILLFYSLGFWGLVLFKKNHKISFVAFLPLFLLFNFNGHIVSHLSVGHLTWASYFLFSFFFLLIFEIFTGQSSNWKWIGKISFLQLFIFLSGGYHLFVWGLLLLGAIFIFTKNKKIIFYALLFSVLINSFRIFPAALISNDYKIDFLAGFPTLESILGGLAYISLPSKAYYPMLQKIDIMVWEQNFYLSIVGLGFIIFYGIILLKGSRNYELVMMPSIIMLILSTGNIYKVFFNSGIPLISGERISTRFLIIAILYLLFQATIQFQANINFNTTRFMKVCFLIGIFFIANDLSQHIAHWGIENIINIFPKEIYFVSLSLGSGINYQYMTLLFIGSSITVLIFVFLIIKISRTAK